jgi:hypothetical protein
MHRWSSLTLTVRVITLLVVRCSLEIHNVHHWCIWHNCWLANVKKKNSIGGSWCCKAKISLPLSECYCYHDCSCALFQYSRSICSLTYYISSNHTVKTSTRIEFFLQWNVSGNNTHRIIPTVLYAHNIMKHLSAFNITLWIYSNINYVEYNVLLD